MAPRSICTNIILGCGMHGKGVTTALRCMYIICDRARVGRIENVRAEPHKLGLYHVMLFDIGVRLGISYMTSHDSRLSSCQEPSLMSLIGEASLRWMGGERRFIIM